MDFPVRKNLFNAFSSESSNLCSLVAVIGVISVPHLYNGYTRQILTGLLDREGYSAFNRYSSCF